MLIYIFDKLQNAIAAKRLCGVSGLRSIMLGVFDTVFKGIGDSLHRTAKSGDFAEPLHGCPTPSSSPSPPYC